MSESFLAVLLLSLISCCLLAMALAIIWVAFEVHATCRRLNAMLPGATLALRDVHHVLQQGRRLLLHANRTTGQVEGVVHQACLAASRVLERLANVQGRLETVWSKWLGNGAGAGPRRRHHSG